MRKRALGILIRDEKLLFVTGYKSNVYWLPGGKVEEAENVLEALNRELKEEISFEFNKATLYLNLVSPPEIFNGVSFPEYDNYYYIVEGDSEVVLKKEIDSSIWLGREDMSSSLIDQFDKVNIVSKLIEDNYL